MQPEESETRLASLCYLPFGLCRADNIPSTLIGKPELEIPDQSRPSRPTRNKSAISAIDKTIIALQVLHNEAYMKPPTRLGALFFELYDIKTF